MRRILIDYVARNKKNFIIIIILFLIGVSIGIFLVNNSNEIQKAELNSYVENLINNIKNSENINSFNLLVISLKQNIGYILLIWLLGCTVIGGVFIYIAILYKGFSIGYTIATMIAVLGLKHGTIISIISLLFQNIIFLPALFIISENRNKII